MMDLLSRAFLFVILIGVILITNQFPVMGATVFFANDRFTENGIDWCQEERPRFELIGDDWYAHHKYSIESRICGNLYQDPLWDYSGPDRTQKLIEKSAYYVQLEIAESVEEAETGVIDPTPAETNDPTSEILQQYKEGKITAEELEKSLQDLGWPSDNIEMVLENTPVVPEDQKEMVELHEKKEDEKNNESTKEGGCLIATATFDSELSTQVQQLREFRDNVILPTKSGASFMDWFNQFYYLFSPTVADWERQSPIFKNLVKITITPLLTSLLTLNQIDIDSETELIGYGIGIISLNVGMYFVIPALFLIKIKKWLPSLSRF